MNMLTPIGCLFLLLIWVSFHWLYLDYRVDYLRQTLFALRDELFDIALAGDITFDDNAYRMMRDTINGTIQHAHRIGFMHLFFFNLFTSGNKYSDKQVERFTKTWHESLDNLPQETRLKIISIRKKLHYHFFELLLFTSPLLMFFLILTLLGMVLKRAQGAVARFSAWCLSMPKIKQFMNELDCAALTKVT